MTTFVVKLIVEGRNTQVRIDANDAAAATRLARDMYSGNSVRVLETSRAKS
jgi:hypothetical protein